MRVEAYMRTDFVKSNHCQKVANTFNEDVKKVMVNLAKRGTCSNITARMISPFVGVGALIVSLVLRIGYIIEPFIGFVADIAVAIYCKSSKPISRLDRGINMCINPFVGVGFIVRDIFKICFVAGFGGTVAPVRAYKTLA